MANTDKNGLGNVRLKSSRLSLKGQRQLSDISPAPVPRSSHRIRTGSSDSEDKPKTNTSTRRIPNSNKNNSNYVNHSEGNNKFPTSEAKETSSANGTLLNGFSFSGRVHGICPLANLGNTCFLNSVLYALRFLPGFAHDLHHLHSHLQIKGGQELSSSLSERFKFLSELHNVFTLLREEENSYIDGKRIPALQPHQFLESVRSSNPQFEGNRQQDAHELLHWLLDQLNNLPQDLIKGDVDTVHPRAKRRKTNRTLNKELDDSKNFDVVGSKFVGKMSLETRCVECEQTNSREECFIEVCVPVKTKFDFDDDEEMTDTQILLTALCTEDSLVGSNKYWCEFCSHHNEAKRFVHFRTLPLNLVIHVKRFSSYTTRTFASKCCDAMPAPFELPCFCKQCTEDKEKVQRKNVTCNGVGENGPHNGPQHSPKTNSKLDSVDNSHLPYYLTAFVCHLGATMSSGHYISFIHVNSRSSITCLEKAIEKGVNIRKFADQDVNGSEPKCSFLRCCSTHLDKVLLANTANSKEAGRRPSSIPNEGFWLECDDEKIKVISFAEVSSVLNSTIITPYLLFYSR